MSRPLIWVIEDNDQNFELVDFLLGEAGYDVARARDSDEVAPHIDRERFLAAGCDGYISKPIEADAFLAAVAAFVGADAEFPGDTRQP
jgi:CheY-like chemotaxis protein